MGLRGGMAGNVQARAALVALEGAAPGQVFSLGKQPRFLVFFTHLAPQAEWARL